MDLRKMTGSFFLDRHTKRSAGAGRASAARSQRGALRNEPVWKSLSFEQHVAGPALRGRHLEQDALVERGLIQRCLDLLCRLHWFLIQLLNQSTFPQAGPCRYTIGVDFG